VVTARYVDVPGPEAFGVPAFRFLLPAGWGLTEEPSAWAAMRPADDAATVAMIGSSRVGRTIDLRSVAVSSFARQRRQHPDLRLDSQRVGRFGDRVVYVRSVTLPGVSPLAQVQALFFAPTDERRAVADVFSVVGSCADEQVELYGPTFVDLIASFEFPAR
jgi:hypothetical protein